jgi:Tol biopolymer transport system component
LTRRRLVALGAFAFVAFGVFALLLGRRGSPLPADLKGFLVFVSDREGQDALFVRRLPHGETRRLAVTGESVRDPALSPNDARLAFAMNGRIGFLSLIRGDVRFVTLGIDQRDAEPAFRPDGRALVISSRERGATSGDLVLLELDTPDDKPVRTPLTRTRGLDETSPCFSPDGNHVVFVREDGVFRIAVAGGRAQRLTHGFRKFREPRFLPSGRLLVLWSEEKRFGMDVMDADGRNRETLSEGTAYYRSVTGSPDGRYLAATLTYDLAFRPQDAFRPKKTEEIHLLDERGRFVAVLERWSRHSSHSPEWGR